MRRPSTARLGTDISPARHRSVPHGFGLTYDDVEGQLKDGEGRHVRIGAGTVGIALVEGSAGR